MEAAELLRDNQKLVERFGASLVSELTDVPSLYTFRNGLVYSHRDFDGFYSRLKSGERSAIVSGFNASGTIHLGHRGVFDTNLYFQKEHKAEMFIPISDDESYVSGKVSTQKEGLENSIQLARELAAYGFSLDNTKFIIDQIYTNIYNLAIKFSRRTTLSAIKATYGYSDETNHGLAFYPSVQAAHVLLPEETGGYKNTLVPIGPDEDAHLRICRDIARKEGYRLPSVLHLSFIPGLDGEKMSKSKNNAIFLKDTPKDIRTKVGRALSGGQESVERHRQYGGVPENDMSCIYLRTFFLNGQESKNLFEDYRSGKLLSGEVKQMLTEKVVDFTQRFQTSLDSIKASDVKGSILRNGDTVF